MCERAEVVICKNEKKIGLVQETEKMTKSRSRRRLICLISACARSRWRSQG